MRKLSLDALAKAGDLVQSRFGGVNVITYKGSLPCPAEVIERAKQECDVIIGSTGD